MGLDTTFDCWHGSYSWFGDFRCELCNAAGMGNLEKYMGYGPKATKKYPSKKREPLVILLNHSDCDGQIEVPDLVPLAGRLKMLKPKVDAEWQDHVQRFIDGLLRAWKARQPVIFG